MNMVSSTKISTLNEKPLHESLKSWYARPGDLFEVPVDDFIVDIVRDGLLVEIQTRNFSSIRRKLEQLVAHHSVRLVYPISSEKWTIRQSADADNPISRRRSPKRGSFEDVFQELVYLPRLLKNPNFSLELLLTHEEELRRFEGIRGWRRSGWVTDERRLLKVVEARVLHTPAEVSSFLPADLPGPFTASDLAAAIVKPLRLAQRMVYCLKHMGCLAPVGKRCNAVLYARIQA